MSNIIHNTSDFVILDDFLNDNLNKENVEQLLKNLLPNKDGKSLIKYSIRDRFVPIAEFMPKSQSINVSFKKTEEWLDLNVPGYSEEIKTCDMETLRKYFVIFLISHEIEHAYQYLMANEIVEAPNSVLKDAYKGLYNLIIPDKSFLPKPISKFKRLISYELYKYKQNEYLLERNASIEGLDLLTKYSLYKNRDDIYKLFNDMRNIYISCGYRKSNIGNIEETYKKILMYNKYKSFYKEVDLDLEDRIRYGFGISEEEREKVLKKAS